MKKKMSEMKNGDIFVIDNEKYYFVKQDKDDNEKTYFTIIKIGNHKRWYKTYVDDVCEM